MEREQHQTEIRDLQDQLSEMHDELDSAKKSAADGEKDMLMVVSHSALCYRKKNKCLLFLRFFGGGVALGLINFIHKTI